jgi:hypothetical protein
MQFLANEDVPVAGIRRLRGVAYFRFAPATPAEPAERFIELLEVGHITLKGQFTAIGRGWIRQRPLPQKP